MAIVAPLEFGICVENIEACLPFYETLLGLVVVARRDIDSLGSSPISYSTSGYRVVKMQAPRGERLKILQSKSSGRRAPSTDGNVLSRPGNAFISIILDKLDPIVSRLESAGITFRTTPHIIQWEPNLRVCVVDDPEGNAVELCEFDDLSLYRSDLS